MAQLRILVTAREDPSVRFRVGAYLSRFQAAGHDAEAVVLPKDSRARGRLFRSLAAADAVVLLRRLLMPFETWRLRRAASRLVFEYDDALLYRDTGRGATLSVARILKFAALVRAADRVVAGSSYLAAMTRPFLRRAAVVPTVLDPGAYPARPPHRDPGRGSRPILGWLGTRANFPYLETLAPDLGRLAADVPFTLRIMAEAPPEIPGLGRARVEFVPWSAPDEVRFLQALDVGLMPLADDAWCRGKCGLKALQYMATGVPVVATDVGVAGTLIGAGGLVLPPHEDWGRDLRRLLADSDLRNQMGAAGRLRVEKEYSPAVWFGRLEALYLGEEEGNQGMRE